AQLADHQPARSGGDSVTPSVARMEPTGPAEGRPNGVMRGERGPGLRFAPSGLQVLALFAAAFAAAPACAQTDWPARPIRLIVPLAGGSSSDIGARIVAQKVGERLKQQLFVENRVGASGDIGSEAVARAKPDGYTLGLANASTHAVAASLASRPGYDPVKD